MDDFLEWLAMIFIAIPLMIFMFCLQLAVPVLAFLILLDLFNIINVF